MLYSTAKLVLVSQRFRSRVKEAGEFRHVENVRAVPGVSPPLSDTSRRGAWNSSDVRGREVT